MIYFMQNYKHLRRPWDFPIRRSQDCPVVEIDAARTHNIKVLVREGLGKWKKLKRT
jgi:hypothetical protein